MVIVWTRQLSLFRSYAYFEYSFPLSFPTPPSPSPPSSLLLSPHSRSLCDIVHDGLPDQPAVLSPVCWLSGGRSCQNLHPLLRGEVEPCLDLSSPSPSPSLHLSTCLCLPSACLLHSLSPPSPPIHPHIDGLLLILVLRPIQKAAYFKQACMGQEHIRTGD